MRPDLPGAQAAGHWDTLPGPGTLAQGNVDDPYLGRLIPLNANLTGPGATTNNHYTVYSLFAEQRAGGLAVEVGYRRRQYWRDNRAVGTGGLLGDPNPVIPGAYFADADSRLAAGRAPGTLLPDIGAPNPYAGKLYVEGSAQTRIFDERSDQFRANVGYELDLTKLHRWLGRLAVSAIWQKDENWGNTWVEVERNLAPNNNSSSTRRPTRSCAARTSTSPRPEEREARSIRGRIRSRHPGSGADSSTMLPPATAAPMTRAG